MCQSQAAPAERLSPSLRDTCADVVILLADHAELRNGLLDATGLGRTWSLMPVGPTAVVINVTTPWGRTGRHDYRLELVTADGEPVRGTEGDHEADSLTIEGHFHVEQPPHLPVGRAVTTLIVVAFGGTGIDLPAGSYVWQLTIDDACRHDRTFDVLDLPWPA